MESTALHHIRKVLLGTTSRIGPYSSPLLCQEQQQHTCKNLTMGGMYRNQTGIARFRLKLQFMMKSAVAASYLKKIRSNKTEPVFGMAAGPFPCNYILLVQGSLPRVFPVFTLNYASLLIPYFNFHGQSSMLQAFSL